MLSISILLPILFSCTSKPSQGGEAGFVNAVFDAATIGSLLSDPACAAVRFYNARRTANDDLGTAIAIGVRSDGTEIQNGSTLKYRMFDVMTGTTVPSIALNKVEAQTRCRYVKDAREKSYSVQFTKAATLALLSAVDCNGVRLLPERTASGLWSMRMYPVKVSSSVASTLTSVSPAFCTEPCPSFCGPPGNYINL